MMCADETGVWGCSAAHIKYSLYMFTTAVCVRNLGFRCTHRSMYSMYLYIGHHQILHFFLAKVDKGNERP